MAETEKRKRTDLRIRPKQVDVVRLYCVCGTPLALRLTNHRTGNALATWHQWCKACARHIYLEVTG